VTRGKLTNCLILNMHGSTYDRREVHTARERLPRDKGMHVCSPNLSISCCTIPRKSFLMLRQACRMLKPWKSTGTCRKFCTAPSCFTVLQVPDYCAVPSSLTPWMPRLRENLLEHSALNRRMAATVSAIRWRLWGSKTSRTRTSEAVRCQT